MTTRKNRRLKRDKSLQERAFSNKAKHEKQNAGKKMKLIPHPTIPKTWIEVEDKN